MLNRCEIEMPGDVRVEIARQFWETGLQLSDEESSESAMEFFVRAVRKFP
jgi:hypothetical protein